MPAEPHPSLGELRDFFAGALPSPQVRAVVAHLLSGCETCRGLGARLWAIEVEPDEAALAAAVDRALGWAAGVEAGIERQRREAGPLLAQLERLPASRQLLLVLNSRRFRNWFVGERLVERALETALTEPERAVELAEVAVALADRLAGSADAEAVCFDLAARAWAALGNVRRIVSDLAQAEEAFTEAVRRLESGSGDLLEEGTVARMLGTLRHDQRRFEEAVRCFDRAIRTYRLAGDRHLVGRALAEKARALGESGHPDQMVSGLRQAVQLLDPQREPRVLLAAQHNLTWALTESGRLDEALSLLGEILPLHARSGKPMDLLRLRWLEGKLAQAQGELERAEAAFGEVRRGFLDRKIPYDAAVASLDLAAVLYEQGRLGEMKRLAAESLPVFRALGVHREALAALAMFEKAVEKERVSLRWIADLAAYLQRARHDPSLAFQPST